MAYIDCALIGVYLDGMFVILGLLEVPQFTTKVDFTSFLLEDLAVLSGNPGPVNNASVR